MKCSKCGAEASGEKRWRVHGKAFCRNCVDELGKDSPVVPLDTNVPWVRPIGLQENEKVVNWFSNLHQFFEIPGETFGGRSGNKGYLIVTNRRLAFSHKSGMFSDDFAVTWGIDLQDIMSVSHGKWGFTDKLVILDRNGRRTNFVAKNVQIAIPEINKIMIARVSEIEAAKKREGMTISLDFSWVKDYMQKGGLVLANVKCPNCGAPVKLPESGGSVLCQSCGSSVLAVDVFQKMKELIG